MAKFALVPYFVRVKHRNNYVGLANFNGTNLLDVSRDFFTTVSSVTTDIDYETALDCQTHAHVRLGTGDFIIGTFRSGRLGEETDVVELATNTTVDSIGRDKIPMSRVFFLLEIPPQNRDEAILMLQTYKTFGIKTQLERTWRRDFSSKNRRYSLEMNPLVPSDYIQAQVARSNIKEIRLVKFGFNKNRVIDSITGGHAEAVEKVELVLKGSSLPIKERVAGWLGRSNRQASELIEVAGDIGGLSFDEVIIELDDEGTRRTLRMSTGKTTQYRIPLSDRVRIEAASGLPVFDDIAAFAAEAATQIRKTVNRGDNELDEGSVEPSTPTVLTYV